MKTLEKIPGNRRPDNTNPYELQPGEYAKCNFNGEWSWYIKTPNGIGGWLKNHKCIENEDGTLSVLPPGPGEGANSILATDGTTNATWHGFIYNGVWREIG